jgi:predicted O-methyltransferase YrrM
MESLKINHTLESLMLVRFISDSINNQTMHHHYHILYDIANTYPENQNITYVEIGCYAGGSACLMLQRPNTKVISIDLGEPIHKEIVYSNVKKLNKFNNSYSYLEGNSQTYEMVDRLKELVDSIDMLFIDGDHSYQAVINDFMLYEGLVKPEGFIIFDDYHDYGSPGTKIAVDEIAKNTSDKYDIIGTLPNIFKARGFADDFIEGNDFIMQKKKNNK